MIRTLGMAGLALAAAMLAVGIPSVAEADILFTPIDFGSVPVNQLSSRSVAITLDPGYQVGTVSTLPGSFSASVSNCAGTTCQLDANFLPTGTGLESQSVTVSECPAGGGACRNVEVPVSGKGTSVFAASNLNFGSVTVGQAADQPIGLTLDPGYQLSSVGGATGAFGLDLGSGLPACDSGSCQIDASFTPTTTGPTSDPLDISECPVDGGPCLTISPTLEGDGTPVNPGSDGPGSNDPGNNDPGTPGSNGPTQDLGFQPDSVQPIPEPASLLIFATGLAGLAGGLRRRRSKEDGKVRSDRD